MKAKRFCELIELAIREEYGTESNFDTVPYLSEEAGAVSQECLGVFLTEDVHMGVVAARAQAIQYSDLRSGDVDDDEISDAINQFAEIMSAMRIAPYMQWHCAYFPGLTEAQVLSDAEAFDDSAERLDTSGTEVDNGRSHGAPDEAIMTASHLYAELKNVGANVRWYSGRGMMGVECVAVAGSPPDLLEELSMVRERANDATQVALNVFQTDDLGHDTVMYWPEFKKEQ